MGDGYSDSAFTPDQVAWLAQIILGLDPHAVGAVFWLLIALAVALTWRFGTN